MTPNGPTKSGFEVVFADPIQACPVCNGSGNVAAHFYNTLPKTTPTVICQACEGHGLILRIGLTDTYKPIKKAGQS